MASSLISLLTNLSLTARSRTSSNSPTIKVESDRGSSIDGYSESDCSTEIATPTWGQGTSKQARKRRRARDRKAEEERAAVKDEKYVDFLGGAYRRPARTAFTAGSICSADEAKSSVDLILNHPGLSFSQADKLRVWQGLCYELGLADFNDRLPMPRSLTAAKNLLRAKGHVNIRDLFDARKSGLAGFGCYAHLVHRSSGAMIRYTIESGKYVKRKVAKKEVLQPLMRDML